MASITPLVSTSNTEQSTASQTLVDSTESIAGASLANGVKHLVLYSVAYGGNDESAEPEVVVLHGETVIGRGGDEAEAAYTTTMAMTGSTLSSPYVITGDGVNALKIQFRSRSSSDTAYIKGSTLIAIPLGDLVEGTDYFYAQQNGDTAEESATTGDQIVLWDSFTLPDTGDYLVLGGLEGTISSGGANTEGWRMGLTIGTTQKEPMRREWEDSDAGQSFSYGRVHALNSGSNTISVFGGTGQGTTAVKEYRRGRIFVFNLAATSFDKTANETSDGETEVTDSYPTYTDLLSHAYTPNQQEYVLVIGNVMGSATGYRYPVTARLQNSTDAAEFGDFAANAPHDEDTDHASLTMFACEQIAAVEKTYKLQVSGHGAAGDSAYFEYPDLIILSLTTGAATGLTTKTFTEAAVHTDTKERGLVMARTHTEGAQRSEVITIPSGPGYYVAPPPLGDDNNDGTSSGGPFATLQHAIDTVPVGSWIYVADGNYTGPDIDGHMATAGAHTNFYATGSSAVIDEVSTGWNSPFISVYQSSYIEFHGFTIDGTGHSWDNGAGIFKAGARVTETTWVEFNGCVFTETPGYAVFTGEASDIRMIDCTTNNCMKRKDSGHTVYYGNSTTGYPMRNMVVQGCTFNPNTTQPECNHIHWNGASYSAGGDNTIQDSTFDSNILIGTPRSNFLGCVNCRITNNLLYDEWDNLTGIHMFGEEDGTISSDYRPASNNNVIANNTIINTTGNGIGFQASLGAGLDGAYDNYCFNNLIVYKPAGSAFGGYTSAQYISNDNIELEHGDFNYDDYFTDADNDDYTILDGSAAHDAGIPAYLGKSAPTTDLAGVSRPQNGFFDIGAYEIYHSSGPVSKTINEAAAHSEILDRGITASREHAEAAVLADTFERTVLIVRTYSEAAIKAGSMLNIALIATPDEYYQQISDTFRRSDILLRVVTGSRTLSEAATHTDTLERTATYNRELTDAVVRADTLDQTNVPPASSVIGVVGYVSDGIVGAETG